MASQEQLDKLVLHLVRQLTFHVLLSVAEAEQLRELYQFLYAVNVSLYTNFLVNISVVCVLDQNVSDWTPWAPGCSPSAPVQQSREQMYLPCDLGIACETNCSNNIETRISK